MPGTNGLILPSIIEPTDKAVQLFGILKTRYFLDIRREIYIFEENSGIIRSGISIEFYNKYRYYFISIE